MGNSSVAVLLLAPMIIGAQPIAPDQIPPAYTLDNMMGEFYFYPGPGYLCLIPSGSKVTSFHDLKARLEKLPRGARLVLGRLHSGR
jgi:hypothetical protein